MTTPGTHYAASGMNFAIASTHRLSVTEQISMEGIQKTRHRYTKGENNYLCAYHKDGPIHCMIGGQALLSIESIFGELSTFLKTNGHGGIIVQMKQDRNPEKLVTAAGFVRDISSLIATKSLFWLTAATCPITGDLRGKIQLVRRFQAPAGQPSFGIDVTGPDWGDNATIPALGRPTCVQIQDVWDLRGIPWQEIPAYKFDNVKNHLEKTAVDKDKSALYLNFASADAAPYMESELIALGEHQDVATASGVHERLDTQKPSEVWRDLARLSRGA